MQWYCRDVLASNCMLAPSRADSRRIGIHASNSGHRGIDHWLAILEIFGEDINRLTSTFSQETQENEMTLWHEAKHELPSNKDDVLVSCLDSQSFAVAYYDGAIWRVDGSVFDEGNFRLTLALDVTHWCELTNFNE